MYNLLIKIYTNQYIVHNNDELSCDQKLVNQYLKNPKVRALLTAEQRYAKFVWGIPQVLKKSEEDNSESVELVELYALKGNRENKPQLSGAVITDARQSYQQNYFFIDE